MKRSPLLVICILVISILIAGCATPQQATQPATEQPAAEKPAETAAPAKSLRIAAVLPGRIDDGTFSQQLFEGLMEAKNKLGDQIEVSYLENKYQVVDIEPALQDYASQGYDLIFGHGFQYQDPIMKIAPQYPKVNFAIGPGAYMTADNVVTYDLDNGEVGYALGTVAGLVTKSNKIGSVQGLIVPNTAAMVSGFVGGAEAVNPEVEHKLIVVGSFDDADGGREAANALIDQGVDVVFSGLNNPAPLDATEARGVFGVLFSNDLTSLFPKSMLASTIADYSVVTQMMVVDILANQFGKKHYSLTFNNGGLSLKYRSDLGSAAKEKIEEVVNSLNEGTIIMPTPVPAQ